MNRIIGTFDANDYAVNCSAVLNDHFLHGLVGGYGAIEFKNPVVCPVQQLSAKAIPRKDLANLDCLFRRRTFR